MFELGTDGPALIVVGVDGSPTSLRAAAYAGGLARRQKARLALVFVHTVGAIAGLAPGAVGPMLQASADTLAEITKAAEESRRHYEAEDMTIEIVERRGDPYNELVRVADEMHADAVVVGASTQAGHRFVGSLAAKLVKTAHWPVTVVP